MNTLLNRQDCSFASRIGVRPERSSALSRRLLGSGLGFGLALVTALAPLPTRGADEPVDLRPKWKVGQRMVQQMKTTQTQKIAMPGTTTPMQQKTEQIQDLVLSVEKERPEGGYELALEFLSMKMESKMGETVMMKFDSKNAASSGDANPMTGAFKKLVGAKFKLLTTSDGEIEKVEGVQKLIEEMASGMPEMVAGMLKGMFNEDMAKQMSTLPQDLPKEPVSPGYEWPVKMEVTLGPMGTIVINMKNKFTGMERRRDYQCAVFDHKGFISSKPGSGSGPLSFSSISGTSTGRTYYCPSIGATIDSFADQKMKMTMKMGAQDTNVEMDQRVTAKLSEVTGQAE